MAKTLIWLLTIVISSSAVSIGGVAEGAKPSWIPETLVTSTFDVFIKALAKDGGKASLDSIKDRFAPAPASSAKLAIQLDELTMRVGPPMGFEIVCTNSLKVSERLFRAVILVYHDEAPTVWEIVFYRREKGWTILELSYSTEDVLDRAGDLFHCRAPG